LVDIFHYPFPLYRLFFCPANRVWGHYGYYVKIQHDGTFDTLYAHCSSICVTPGQQVQQGEVIGYVGSTGNSTGNHLHFEVWENGQRMDAMALFNQV